MYSSFRLRDGLFPYQFEDSAHLAQLFLAGAEHTRHHYVYQRPGGPLVAHKPIQAYFTATPGHFTAIMPHPDSAIRFIPVIGLS